jgi:hypothetical protein
MKRNELVRPAGIGRKQVAFSTSVTPSPLSQAVDDLNTLELTAQSLDTVTGVTGFAESAAYSAATATQNAVQNFPFEVTGIREFWFVGSANIQWNFNTYTIVNPYIFYDPRLQEFTLRKPGWYYIKCMLFTTATNANVDWWVSLITPTALTAGLSERHAQYMDYTNAYKHCHLNGSALLNVPTQNGQWPQGERKFSLQLGTTHAGSQTLTTANTKANLQIIYLGALPISERATITAV